MSTSVSSPKPSETTQGTDLYWRQVLLGVFYLLLPILLIYLVFKIFPPYPWPVDKPDVPDAAPALKAYVPITFLRGTISVWTSLEERLLLLVIVAGALGSYVHAATSFADYLGNRKFTSSWTWWYVLRPFIGVVLALVIYFAIRGGFLLLVTNGATEAKDINPFGIGALAALTGMFSKQATDKLNEVFSTLFKSSPGEGDDKREDGLTAPDLAITSIDPTTGPTAGENKVTITGTAFVSDSTVSFGDAEATSVSIAGPTTITAIAPAHGPGVVDVKIQTSEGREAVLENGYTYVETPNGGAGGGGGAATPAPTITNITPNSGSTEGKATVTILGTNFSNDAAVSFGGTPALDVKVIDATSIIVMTPAHEEGSVDVVVTNPGGQSTTSAGAYTYNAAQG
jgi:hypothetical protein